MCYAKSPLYQERDVCEFHDWTPGNIVLRHDTLLTFVFDRREIESVDPSQLNLDRVMMPPDAAEDGGSVSDESAPDGFASPNT
jgi:hypothetical protein